MLKAPTRVTLAKYGLSMFDWFSLWEGQCGLCAICKREPSTGRLCVDHEHAKGWKRMPPKERRKYVRGLLCWVCNHYSVGRGVTLPKLRQAALYFERYEGRQNRSVNLLR